MRALVLALLVTASCREKSVPPADPTPIVPTAADTSCTKDDDCAPAPECCPAPCTVHVVNRAALAKIVEHNAATCPKEPQCVSAGSCPTHAYLCVEKTCQLVYSDAPGFRPRVP